MKQDTKNADSLTRDEHVPACGLYGCDGTPAGHALRVRALPARTRGAS